MDAYVRFCTCGPVLRARRRVKPLERLGTSVLPGRIAFCSGSNLRVARARAFDGHIILIVVTYALFSIL